jgi:hypothetical protein
VTYVKVYVNYLEASKSKPVKLHEIKSEKIPISSSIFSMLFSSKITYKINILQSSKG